MYESSFVQIVLMIISTFIGTGQAYRFYYSYRSGYYYRYSYYDYSYYYYGYYYTGYLTSAQKGAVAGGVIGSIVVLSLIVGCCVYCCIYSGRSRPTAGVVITSGTTTTPVVYPTGPAMPPAGAYNKPEGNLAYAEPPPSYEMAGGCNPNPNNIDTSSRANLADNEVRH